MEVYQQLITLSLAAFAGVSLFALARHIHVPVIILLLGTGILLGPECLNLVQPATLGSMLRVIIALCVAIILFEGGLTLRPEGLQKTPRVIWRLLTIGVLVTWLGTAALIFFFMGYSVELSLLAGSLIIVTGPTVIAPLLKRIKVKEELFHILHWEGVLIDPIGVFIAILCFELMSIQGSFWHQVGWLSIRLVVGSLAGILGGRMMIKLLDKEIIPEEQTNIFVVASALFIYSVCDAIVHEAGILAVVIAGLVLGLSQSPRIKRIQKFKMEITQLAIALVFILLAANLQLNQFLQLGTSHLLIILAVMFLIRPLNIFLCSTGTSLSMRDKGFLSWVSPRGIIAGSMASLFGLELEAMNIPGGIFIETFTFSIIIATIVCQGMTAGYIAKWLKVEEPIKKGWMIIGSHLFARQVGSFIQKTTGGLVVHVDTATKDMKLLLREGGLGIQGNALSTDVLPPNLMHSIGHLLALTDNRELNQLVCQKWSDYIPKDSIFRWTTEDHEQATSGHDAGIPVWQHLEKPSQVSFHILNKEALLQTQRKGQTSSSLKKKEHLLTFRKGHFYTAPPEHPEETFDHVLLLEKLTRNLLGILKNQHILFMKPAPYSQLLTDILEHSQKLHPDIPHESLIHELVERESQFPTTLVNGIAAPHAHTTIWEEPVCYIAQVSRVHDLNTPDGVPVRLIFLLLSPVGQAEQHLRLLAEIAKIASTASVVQDLHRTRTTEEFMKHLEIALLDK